MHLTHVAPTDCGPGVPPASQCARFPVASGPQCTHSEAASGEGFLQALSRKSAAESPVLRDAAPSHASGMGA